MPLSSRKRVTERDDPNLVALATSNKDLDNWLDEHRFTYVMGLGNSIAGPGFIMSCPECRAMICVPRSGDMLADVYDAWTHVQFHKKLTEQAHPGIDNHTHYYGQSMTPRKKTDGVAAIIPPEKPRAAAKRDFIDYQPPKAKPDPSKAPPRPEDMVTDL